MNLVQRLRYTFLVLFVDRPNALARRVDVENALLAHYKNKTSPSPEDCKTLAFKLGVPR